MYHISVVHSHVFYPLDRHHSVSKKVFETLKKTSLQINSSLSGIVGSIAYF